MDIKFPYGIKAGPISSHVLKIYDPHPVMTDQKKRLHDDRSEKEATRNRSTSDAAAREGGC